MHSLDSSGEMTEEKKIPIAIPRGLCTIYTRIVGDKCYRIPSALFFTPLRYYVYVLPPQTESFRHSTYQT